MNKRSNLLHCISAFVVVGLSACGREAPSDATINLPEFRARQTAIPTPNWTITADGSVGPRYLSNPFSKSLDTLWLTIKDTLGIERFDASGSVSCDYAPFALCSVVGKFQSGGTKSGLLISVPGANKDGQARGLLVTTGVTRASAWVTYRMSAVASAAITPANPSVAYGSTQQFTATALDAWNRNVNSLFPPVFSSSNTNVGTVNSTGLFTPTGCGGTTTVRADYDDGFTPKNVQTTVTVTCPYTIRVSADETPLTRLVGDYNYSVTVGRYDLNGTFLGNVSPTATIGNASIATIGAGASTLMGISAGNTTLSLSYAGAPTISVPVNVFAISMTGPSSMATSDTATFTASPSGPGGPYVPYYWTNGEEGGASLFTSCAGSWSCTTTGSLLQPGQAIYLTVTSPTGMQFRKSQVVSVP